MEYEATKWWRVIDSEGDLWCETSVEKEARNAMRPGDSLQRLHVKREYDWKEEPNDNQTITGEVEANGYKLTFEGDPTLVNEIATALGDFSKR